MLKYSQLLMRLQWIWFVACLLRVSLRLLFGGVLEIILSVQIGLQQEDVAFGDVVRPHNTQTDHQNGTDLNHRHEDCPQSGEDGNEEDPDDEIDEDGERDPPGHVVLLPRALYHERAQEADEGQAPVVAMHQGKGRPGCGATHEQNLRGQRAVVRQHVVRAQVQVAEAEEALGEEAQGYKEPGPARCHPTQGSAGTAGELCEQDDLQGLDEESGEAGIEAQGTDNLLHHAEVVSGLPYEETGAEAHQRECKQGKEVQVAPSSLHKGGVEVLNEEHRCQTDEGYDDGHGYQQAGRERLVPTEVSLAAVVALRAPGRRPLVLQAGSAGGAVCKVAVRRAHQERTCSLGGRISCELVWVLVWLPPPLPKRTASP